MSLSLTERSDFISPTEAAVYRCCEYWWRVIVRRHARPGRTCGRIDPLTGAPVTRLSATDIRQWLEKRHISLSLRQIRYACQKLVEHGWVLRVQEWQHYNNQSYSYMPAGEAISQYNPDKVGVRPLPPQPSFTPQEPENFSTECCEVQTEMQSQPAESVSSDVTTAADLFLDRSAVDSPSSSSGSGAAEPPDRCAAPEPEQPVAEPARTPTRVEDAVFIGSSQSPIKDGSPGASLNALNRKAPPAAVVRDLIRIDTEWIWSFIERRYLLRRDSSIDRSVRMMESLHSGWTHRDEDWEWFYSRSDGGPDPGRGAR